MKKNKKIMAIVLVIFAITIILLQVTKEKESILKEKDIIHSSNNNIALYLEQDNGNYQSSDTIPQSGYTLNTTKSTCTNSAIPTWDTANNGLLITNLTASGTSCDLYFDIKTSHTSTEMLTILGKTVNNNCSVTTNGTEGSVSSAATTNEGICAIEDEWGPTYYYRGAVNDNWIKFAGIYWRIIRINGDGSIRMIYSGTTAPTSSTATVMTGESTQIGTSSYNINQDDNAYVGYMYGTTGANTYELTHSNVNNSTIKTYLENWYTNNLLSYNQYLSFEVGFCNDRGINQSGESWYQSDTALGYAKNATAYNIFGRLFKNWSWQSIQNATYKCASEEDLFTTNISKKGNKKLTLNGVSKPIGTLTADEAIFAGAFGGTANTAYYLYTGQSYWTMTPFWTNTSGNAQLLFMNSNQGYISTYGADSNIGVRPVINLNPTVTVTGSGTYDDVYKVVGASD